ncbi:MAG: molybdenum cofactor biosynthesis protein B [Candidatus Bathyarchaeia archaeon]
MAADLLSPSSKEHRSRAPTSVSFALITCSGSRYMAMMEGKAFSDESGELAKALIEAMGHRVTFRSLVPNSKDILKAELLKAVQSPEVDMVLVLGGSGLSSRDISVEVLESLWEKSIPGFGEFFRRLSYERIGLAAMLSRASGGIVNRKAVFILPGSSDAVELALRNIILPEAGHIILHLRESPQA